jgi:hypothetical protein
MVDDDLFDLGFGTGLGADVAAGRLDDCFHAAVADSSSEPLSQASSSPQSEME